MIVRWAGVGCAALILIGIVWSAGFGWFLLDARAWQPVPERADGIVVLTGGVERIDTALRLLAEGRAPAMLISGVGRHSDLGEISREAAGLGERITLGREALTTVGNAAEVADWARQRGMTRLIVVTAGYHMRRSLREIGRALPEATLHPVRVQPPVLRDRPEIGGAHLLATEYDKWLAVELGFTRLVRMRATR